MDVKTAIQSGDADALRRLISAAPACVDGLIPWGEKNNIQTHPLHYMSDMVFDGTLAQEKAVALARVLIEAGAEIDFQREGKGDTPLIGAASLGAEDVGLLLAEAGARREVRGIFGETALHWAAMLGEDRLVGRLVEGLEASEIDVEDSEYHSTPLGWAIHGFLDPPSGNVGRQEAVIYLLVEAGAKVRDFWLSGVEARGHPKMMEALRRGL